LSCLRRQPSPARLDFLALSFNPRPGVEDWEQFFVEKSRRRFDKERAERRRMRTQAYIAGGIITILIVGGIVALAILR